MKNYNEVPFKVSNKMEVCSTQTMKKPWKIMLLTSRTRKYTLTQEDNSDSTKDELSKNSCPQRPLSYPMGFVN